MSSAREQMIEEAAREALRFLAIDRVAIGAGPNEATSVWADGLPELAGEREHWQAHIIGELSAALRGEEQEMEDGERRTHVVNDRIEPTTRRGHDGQPVLRDTPSIGDEVTMYADPETGESVQGAPDFGADGAPRHDQTKTCKGCGENKPMAEFSRNSRLKDGRESKCKPCHNAAERERRQRSLEKRKEREDAPADNESSQAAVVSSDTTAQTTRTCANGTSCLSYAQLGAPAKLSRSNNDSKGRCYPCADAETDRTIAPAYGRSSERRAS